MEFKTTFNAVKVQKARYRRFDAMRSSKHKSMGSNHKHVVRGA